MFQLIMPKMGESVAEATILKWLKREGDAIAVVPEKITGQIQIQCVPTGALGVGMA